MVVNVLYVSGCVQIYFPSIYASLDAFTWDWEIGNHLLARKRNSVEFRLEEEYSVNVPRYNLGNYKKASLEKSKLNDHPVTPKT